MLPPAAGWTIPYRAAPYSMLTRATEAARTETKAQGRYRLTWNGQTSSRSCGSLHDEGSPALPGDEQALIDQDTHRLDHGGPADAMRRD